MDTLRIGKISSINYANGTARVLYTDRDNAVTAELPLLSFEYCMPAIDDLVLVCHLPNGGAAGIILGRFWCEGNRPVEFGEGLYRKDLDRGGNCYIKYSDGILKIHSLDKMEISCSGGVYINGYDAVTIDPDSIQAE